MAASKPNRLSLEATSNDHGDIDPLASGSGLSSAGRVFQELRTRIVGLKLPPGTILNRAELAEAFAVSQSPVREAILRLEGLGLVVSYPQSRTEVTRIAPVRLAQENFLRTALECEMVDTLCRADPMPDLKKAKGYLKIQEALADDPEQIELFRELDESFHQALFIAAGQSAMHAHAAERSGHMARLRTLDLPRSHKLQSVIEGHTTVIERIEAGDRHGAVDAMRAHLSGTIGRLPEIMAAYPEYFT
ncbi:GntR family transcriptional regulator [Sedimentitalea sp. JM2-8]|uniref:GntR family transcriptional regulator n=1 Tax=Sedimentitalea xiamensis TaxID=3050037 RepID=A0ABT7FA54_9RHOB|nr:GntR family transcriptional regulator [Sedimentitalea xiamensis]MDK3071995.1 GntR family transcriptional regulator [Sedimentitalea xiamensis]